MTHWKHLLLVCLLTTYAVAQGQKTASARQRGPVIDMHMHAMPADAYGPPPLGMCTPITMPTWDPAQPYMAVMGDFFKHPSCSNPIWSPMTDDAVMRDSIAAMKQSHVVLGMLSGRPKGVATWRQHAPAGAFLAGLEFDLSKDTASAIRQLHAAKQLDVLAEIGTQYEGIAPNDARLEPVWAEAEALDLPVGIHMGPGPPGAAYAGMSGMRGRLSSPLLLEDVLVKHPKLRLYIMHAGFPMSDDLLAVLYNHPQVYVDTGVIDYTQPRAIFYSYLKRIVDAGFANRIMYGSDQMIWPGTIERSIQVIEDDPDLTADQKRDILYNNAARFLRLPMAAR